MSRRLRSYCDFIGGVAAGDVCSNSTHDAFAATSGIPPRLKSMASSFAIVDISFNPRIPEMGGAQIMKCESDLAVCNRECERLFNQNQAEMEQPCKLAVIKYFTGVSMDGGGFCFPGVASVFERNRGTMCIADVKVGDEIASDNGTFSRVVAFLHDDPQVVVLYLRIRVAGGELAISPQHLVRARRHTTTPRFDATGPSWEWVPAQDVRAGDELEAAATSSNSMFPARPVVINEVIRVCLQGAFAPLTASGTLLVDGILCSCYAPPAAWCVSHSVCHRTMMPLRLLDLLRSAIESLTMLDGARDPVLTVDAFWLLPKCSDKCIHPYASGLLRSCGFVKEWTTNNLALENAAV